MPNLPLPASLTSPPGAAERLRHLGDRLRLGDESALGELMKLYWGPLLTYARRFAESEDAAEDLVQESFVRLWRRRRGTRAGTGLQAYLYSTTRNLGLNERRRQDVRSRFLILQGLISRQSAPTPLDAAATDEAERAALSAVGSLPARRREVFELVRYHGLSYREVAEVLQLSPQTVANQMSAALTDLRARLATFIEVG